MSGNTLALTLVCLTAAVAIVIAEWRRWRAGRALFKVIASSSFVILAMQTGAVATGYGRLILIALLLSWAGDVFLLSRRDEHFLAGVGSFLLAHIAFAAAFASLPLEPSAVALGLLGTSTLGSAFLVWLWPRVSGVLRIAVSFYVAVISVMTAFALAVGAALGSPLVPGAALAFAASDIAVARDRFISCDITNRAWGLPLYYFAQILFAVSVTLFRS